MNPEVTVDMNRNWPYVYGEIKSRRLTALLLRSVDTWLIRSNTIRVSLTRSGRKHPHDGVSQSSDNRLLSFIIQA